ncbi:MarR family winged helix-turn-helix transcriptional regulator [Pseudarthrobacter raffinosi]|uniref:MarR family winged helix-turn-helix transcriptional regulator n=1 Tax=Pseudarthrobacter raffinosi TaxID=2953651 RepID=UPI00208FED49|nr:MULTISPECIES: MarR family transcriptional regulator [unclassified Pseudarthrobacter]MCO4236827.1 MarR family transcriptional regulator [Pseudarthrobacter sp. MDT3-28]MCO4263584.1 MarR family transcriptional regulator [Pseudarthrobacter sp. MDT3-26]
MTDEAFQRPPDSAPFALVRLLQDFTLEANRYVDTAGGRNDMHRTDLNALAVIMRHTAKGLVVTPGILRRELNLSSPATTALIDRLDSSGHVVRERLGPDRRQVQLRMTPKAFQDGSAIFMPLSRHMGAAMAGFSPEELELVSRFMAAMVDATIAAREETSDGGPASPTPPK